MPSHNVKMTSEEEIKMFTVPRIIVCVLLLAAFFLPTLANDGKDQFPRERGRDAKKDAIKNGVEGKTPPKLDVSGWLNTDGKALSWSDLRGKVVVIDFWGTW